MEMEAVAKPRLKHFTRAQTPAPIELTARDLTMLAHVARHRFLSSAHLAALDGGSKQNVQRVLRALYDHGYLDRPPAQLAKRPLEGGRPFVYGIGKRGAAVLRQHGHAINDGVDWTEKHKRAGSFFIEHTLEIAEFMVGVELACRQRDDVRLLRERDVLALAPQETQHAREPLRLTVESPQRVRRETWSVIPDGLFALLFADETASYFVLEVDRGTIPLTRTDVEGTPAWRKNIAYKFATYHQAWRIGRHLAQYGEHVKAFRVLTVTRSKKRVEHMLDVLREVTEGHGSNMFLFIDRETLAASDPLTLEWTTGKGRTVRLVE
jgi:hypothetical protein